MTRTSLVVLVTSLIASVRAHPQCLDSRPPFEPAQKLQFCNANGYGDFGCCSLQRDQQLSALFDRLSARARSECRAVLRTLICQQCSPYAAHLYNAEGGGQVKAVPGLCNGYCADQLFPCRDILPLLTDDAAITGAVTSQSLCTQLQIPDMDYCYPALLQRDSLTQAVTPQGRNAPGCLCVEPLVKQLQSPVIFRAPPGDLDRVFIGLQLGQVFVYSRNGTQLSREPFLDLRSSVLVSNNRGDERGLLGLAFHPKYSENRKFFVYYSVTSNGRQHIQVSSFTTSTSNSLLADHGTEKLIIRVQQPYWNHNGGEILFGIDGYLYLFLGDGGSRDDPGNVAQNRNSLLGKVLRLDIDTAPTTPNDAAPYKIPPDNPFVNVAAARGEIYALGVRNIWRCDVDEGDRNTRRGRGRIICGDVGQDRWEETDIIVKGGNYGWKAYEGSRCYRSNSLCGKLENEVKPIDEYDHSVGKSITGGHVYRGCEFPNLYGQYIFGDYDNGKLFRLQEDESTGQWTRLPITMCQSNLCTGSLRNTFERHIMSFGEDGHGEIYLLVTSAAYAMRPLGTVYRLVDPRRSADPTTCNSGENRGVAQETSTIRVDKAGTATTTTMTSAPSTSAPTTTTTSTTVSTSRSTVAPTTSSASITTVASTTTTLLSYLTSSITSALTSSTNQKSSSSAAQPTTSSRRYSVTKTTGIASSVATTQQRQATQNPSVTEHTSSHSERNRYLSSVMLLFSIKCIMNFTF